MCEILGQPHWCSQNSISRIKILIFGHHLARGLKSYYDSPFIKKYCYYNFLLTKAPSTINSFMKILFIKKCHSFLTTVFLSPKSSFFLLLCLRNSFVPFLFSLPHYDTILHIAVIIIFIEGSHIFFNYFQFYPSRKALVIKTNAFTIIINLNPFFLTNPN